MRRVGAVIAVLVGVCALAGAALAASIVYDTRLPAAPVSIDVPQGYGIGQIAQQLQDAGVVRSALLLKYYATARGIARSVDAAEYDFPAHVAMSRVVDILASGGKPPVSWVTIPEGFTAHQIAHRLDAMQIVSASAFDDVAAHTSLLLGGTLTAGLEGYLYPDTYQVRRGASAQDIAALMTDQFKRKLPANYERKARHLGYDVPQIITIASLIEREAKVDSERRLMAGVYYNRLKRGMPLEVDATIEYALPEHKTVLHQGDLEIDSPYNTYTHTGLPPTPIANPGARSIAAAFDPQQTDYLYYVYAGHGHHHFSKTLEEQNAAVRRYLH
ncbi:MAG: endolytic transglycosylase MltG [Candidatus Eremiobacteraeota bacterium]|nr:endolytic transglycosylase MltG [Candidatus Eremiobacteraeota bacterium]